MKRTVVKLLIFVIVLNIFIDTSMCDLTFFAENLPEGATLNSVSGEFYWIPTCDQAGIYFVTFGVMDEYGLTDTEIVEITVTKGGSVSTITTGGSSDGSRYVPPIIIQTPESTNTKIISEPELIEEKILDLIPSTSFFSLNIKKSIEKISGFSVCWMLPIIIFFHWKKSIFKERSL